MYVYRRVHISTLVSICRYVFEYLYTCMHGVRIVNFATSKNLVVKSTMFPHRNIHKYKKKKNNNNNKRDSTSNINECQ